MKKINIFFLVLCCLSFFGCEEDDKVTMLDFSNIVAPELEKVLPENFVITETTNLNDEVGYVLWEKGEYGYAASVTYTVQADIHGGTFEEPVELVSSTTDRAVITAKMLNNTAMAYTIESKPITLDLRLKAVVSSTGGDGTAVPVVYSKVKTFTFTPYIAEVPVKDALYIVGGALYGWGNDKANVGKDLQPVFAADSKPGEKIYTYTGFFKSGSGGFKIITQAGNWDTCYAYKGAGLMGANNDGGDFPAPAADGYYTLTVNLADLTFTMVPYAEGATAKRYATIGVIGDATPTGWDSDTDMVETLPHIWVIQKINLIAGKTIKFRADNDWADNWGIGTTTNNIPFGVSSNGGDNFPIEKGGEYLLVLNDLTKHYMIIRTEKLP